MNPLLYKNKKIDELEAKNLVVHNAKITTEAEDQSKKSFKTFALIFLVGVFSFSLALQYNSFSQSLIKRFSYKGHENGLMASAINLFIFTIVVFGILKLIWSYDPNIASQ